MRNEQFVFEATWPILIAVTLLVVVIRSGGGMATASDDEKPPEQIVFVTKNGNVTFLHKVHSDRGKNGCSDCHPSIFPKDATVPLNYKPNLHKTAEANQTSCAACHADKGRAFASKGNCVKCHQKKK